MPRKASPYPSHQPEYVNQYKQELKDGTRVIQGKQETPPHLINGIQAYTRQWKYGLTPEDVQAMLVRQNNVCAICEKLPSLKEKVLGVDHNHTSGKVRGLLCGACNRALGLLKDNPILLRKAETYLARTSI